MRNAITSFVFVLVALFNQLKKSFTYRDNSSKPFVRNEK